MHKLFTSSILIVAVSAVVANAALAGGEPKNERPFTAPAAVGAVKSAAHLAPAPARLAAEQKNELPFTRPTTVAHPQPAVSGEAKNELPFTATATAAVAATGGPGSGFSWTDAALGVFFGVLISAAAAGAALVARHKVPRPA